MQPGERDPRMVLPQGPPAQGGPRRKTQTEDILTNVTGNPVGSAQATFPFVVRTPSVRLVTMLAVTFRPTATEDISTPNFPAGWLLQLDAWIRASEEKNGILMRANNIITNGLLPFALNEPAQGIDEIRGIVTVPFPSGLPTGILYLTATWEPAPGESMIPADELRKLFGICTILVGGGVAFTGSE